MLNNKRLYSRNVPNKYRHTRRISEDYNDDIRRIKDSVRSELVQELNSVSPSLDFSIEISLSSVMMYVNIHCKDVPCLGHDGWKFKAYKDYESNKNATVETSSSTLDVTDGNDIADLRDTVNALEYLVGIDWDNFFDNIELPELY